MPRPSAHHDPGPGLRAFADWLTEDVAQRLYAARQDLADAAADGPADAPELNALRDGLMLIVRSLHEIAGVLYEHADGRMLVARIEELADRVEVACAAAEVLMARGLSLVSRPAGAGPVALLQPLAPGGVDGPLLALTGTRRAAGRGRPRLGVV